MHRAGWWRQYPTSAEKKNIAHWNQHISAPRLMSSLHCIGDQSESELLFYSRSRHFNQRRVCVLQNACKQSLRWNLCLVLTSHAEKSQNHTEHSPHIRNGTKMAARNGSPGCNPGSNGHTSKHGTFLGHGEAVTTAIFLTANFVGQNKQWHQWHQWHRGTFWHTTHVHTQAYTYTHTYIYIYTHVYLYIYTYVCVIYYFIGMHIIGMSRNDKIYRHVAICGYHVKNGMYRCMGMELPNISTHIIDDIDVGTCRVKWSPAISRLQMDEPLISLASAWAAWGVEPSGWNHRVWQGWKYQIIENWNLLFKQCLKSSSEFPWCYILWKRNLAVGGHGCFLSIFFGGNIAAK